jgi:hypothetical protein
MSPPITSINSEGSNWAKVHDRRTTVAGHEEQLRLQSVAQNMQERLSQRLSGANRSDGDQRWLMVVCVAFVPLGRGFVVPRFFIPYSEPLAFIALRNAAAALERLLC